MRLNRKPQILKKFMEGKINNHISLEMKISREYIRQIRTKYQSEITRNLLDKCTREKLHYSPPEYIQFKWLLDAKLVKEVHRDRLKNVTLDITPLGIAWLQFLNSLPVEVLNGSRGMYQGS